MKVFEAPVIEINSFTTEEIITVSTKPDVDDNGYNNELVFP